MVSLWTVGGQYGDLPGCAAGRTRGIIRVGKARWPHLVLQSMAYHDPDD